MNVMNYRGYTARIEFDERDNIFVGRVLGIKAIINFHGETVTELRSDFEAAINHLIVDCELRGITPENPASGKLMLRIPPEIHSAAVIAAQSAGMSLNQWAGRVFAQATNSETSYS
jgi:predicted HicB family RNase H-like nuclease